MLNMKVKCISGRVIDMKQPFQLVVVESKTGYLFFSKPSSLFQTSCNISGVFMSETGT